MSNTGRMRTPLKNVRHLGSAKRGTEHFVRQRVTAVAMLILTPLFVGLIVGLIAAGIADPSREVAQIKAALRHPVTVLLMVLFIGAALVHMRLGMQSIIEDYVHSEGSKIVLLMLNTFFVITLGVAAAYSLLKLALNEF